MSGIQSTTANDTDDMFRAMFDALPGPMCVIDNRGDISLMNVSMEVHLAPNRPRNLLELLVHPVEGTSILDRLRNPDRIQTHDVATIDAISRYYIVTHRLVLPDRPDDRFLVLLNTRAASGTDIGHLAEMMQFKNDERYGQSSIDSTLDVAPSGEVDDLTGLANGPALVKQLDRQWQRAHTFGIEISLLVFDLDDPLADDEERAQLARVVSRSKLRPTDLLARTSDGAFALLLPDTPEAGAMIVQYRLGQFLEQLAPGPVTIGAASMLPDSPDGSAQLLAAGIAALESERRASNASAA